MGEDPKARYGEPHGPVTPRMLLNGLSLCYRITDTGVKQKPYLPKGVKENSCPLGAGFDAMPNGDVVAQPLRHDQRKRRCPDGDGASWSWRGASLKCRAHARYPETAAGPRFRPRVQRPGVGHMGDHFRYAEDRGA